MWRQLCFRLQRKPRAKSERSQTTYFAVEEIKSWKMEDMEASRVVVQDELHVALDMFSTKVGKFESQMKTAIRQ